MFITLFTTAKTWKQPKCLSIDEWIKMWYINTMEYCCCSVMQSCLTFCDYMDCSTPDLPVPWNLPKSMSIALGTPSSHFILWRPLLFLSSVFPSIRDFSIELTVRITWPKYWSFSFSISPSNEYLGLISLKIDWFISLLSQGLSGVFSSTTVQRHQFFGALTSLRFSSHKCTLPLARP